MASRPKISTCVHCRQMKVKCNARETFPAPCSRCRKHSLGCHIDPSFQRTAKRKLAADLEKELMEIKSGGAVAGAVAGSPAASTNWRASQDGSEYSATEHLPVAPPSLPSLPALPSFTESPTVPEYGSCFVDSAFQTQTIGDVILSPSAIADILNCYFTSYHHLFPILPDPSVFVLNYCRCRLLFWALIAIASKSIGKYSHLALDLESHVRLLATDIQQAADYSLGTVQALLLLCWWPLPFKALRDDPSWTYAGLAVHLALRSGLHRPRHFSDFVYGDRLDATGVLAFSKAWVGCFIVNQIIASDLGVPCTVPLDCTILSVIRGTSDAALPAVLVQQLRIAYQSYNICNTLGNNDMTTSGLLPGNMGMIKVFERGLQEVATQMGTKLSTYSEMALLRVKLQLYSFAFTSTSASSASDSHEVRTESRASEYLSKAGCLATQIIATAAQHHAGPSDGRPVQPWPATARSSIVYAVHVLLRLLAYPEHLDQDMAKNYIGQAWMLLHSRSELENDCWARLCDIIAYLSRSCDSTRTLPAAPSVQARMSANVVFQSIWQARGRFSEDVLRQRPKDYTAAEARRDITQFALDLMVGADFLDSGAAQLDAAAIPSSPMLNLQEGELGFQFAN